MDWPASTVSSISKIGRSKRRLPGRSGTARIFSLVGQYQGIRSKPHSWEIPEGGCPESESPEETARRELREETGLVAERLELVATSHLSNSVSDELGYVFRATELVQGADQQEGTERIAVRRVGWEEAWRMYKAGQITDSLSVIAILHEAVRRLGDASK